jgi:hypothetical protein
MTLAYVFWHWSAEAAPAYVARLGAFHRVAALAAGGAGAVACGPV